jgi:DNA-directed RNA polymerase subunit M/transcription elongation factor TFIIS
MTDTAREVVKDAFTKFISGADGCVNVDGCVNADVDANVGADAVGVDAASIARKIERSCYNQTMVQCTSAGIETRWTNVQFVQMYSMNTSRILANLNPATRHSTYLLDKCKEYDKDELKGISNLTNAELCPEASRDINDEIELRLKQKVEPKVSRKYTCKRCGGNETMIIEYQARCADEASSYSIKCVNCEHVQRK